MYSRIDFLRVLICTYVSGLSLVPGAVASGLVSAKEKASKRGKESSRSRAFFMCY